MKGMPRVLPLVGVAVGGVLAVKLIAGAMGAPDMFDGAKAWAEGVAEAAAPKPEAAASAAVDKPAAVCAPTAAELAKQAGLSPAELRVLQSLGDRRQALDQREEGYETQAALIAAAEAKLDAKVKALDALKADINGLLGQADERAAAETARMVKVFESMKAKDAAARIVLLDDEVRLPIAEKMKERALSAVLAQMPPPEAKKLTESLARRYAENAALLAGRAAVQAPAARPPAPASTTPPAQAAAPAATPAAPPAKAG